MSALVEIKPERICLAAGATMKDAAWAVAARLAPGADFATGAEDAARLQRLRAGDERALDELMQRYGPALFGFLRRRVSPRETAEDLFQETWLRVVERCDTYRRQAPLKAWLFRIALNALTDHIRREQALRRGGNLHAVALDRVAELELTTPVRDAQECAIAQEEQGALYKAVAALPAPFREVVRLRYFEELTTAEVAAVLECREGTVKSRLSRGLALLEQSLSEVAR